MNTFDRIDRIPGVASFDDHASILYILKILFILSNRRFSFLGEEFRGWAL